MSDKLGMITTEVRKLGKNLANDAETLTDIATQVTRQLDGTFWKGADAERFRSEWKGQHVRALKQVANALQDAGQHAVKNADQQEKASN